MMQKFLLMAFGFLTMCGVSSAQSLSEAVGTYTGELYISLGAPVDSTTEPMTGQSVDIIAGSTDSTLSLALYNFAFSGTTLGDIELSDLPATPKGDGIVFGEKDAVDLSFLNGAILATAALNTSSYIVGDSLVANLDVVWTNTGGDPVPIYVTFKGVTESEPEPEPEPTMTLADAVGSYTGDLYISLGAPVDSTTEAITGQSVDIVAGSNDSTLTLALYNFAFSGTTLGDIELADLPATPKGDGIVFGEKDAVDLSFLNGAILATAALNTSSYIMGDSLVANLDVVWTNTGGDPMPIYVTFKGVKKVKPEPEPEPTMTLADAVGAYEGNLYISLGAPVDSTTAPITGQKVDILAGSNDSTLTLALFNFAFSGTTLGNIELPDLPATPEGEGIVFGEKDAVSLSFLGGMIEATAALNTSSYIEGDSLVANLDVVWTNTGSDPMPIYVTFKGVKISDIPTGVESVTTDTATSAAPGVYNLSGVRVADKLTNRLPKGIYIVDGKKVIK